MNERIAELKEQTEEELFKAISDTMNEALAEIMQILKRRYVGQFVNYTVRIGTATITEDFSLLTVASIDSYELDSAGNLCQVYVWVSNKRGSYRRQAFLIDPFL